MFDELLRIIGESSDPAGAALLLIGGFARFAAAQGISADHVAAVVTRHMAEQLDDEPDGAA